MAQTRFGSFIEANANVVIGFALNWTMNVLLLPVLWNAANLEAFGPVHRHRLHCHQLRAPVGASQVLQSHRLRQHGARRMTASLPTDAAERKSAPWRQGLLWYFPNALAEVARVSKAGVMTSNNPGQPMHHARGKSTDHADCILRHLVDAGTIDTDGQRHSAKVAWRALAMLQEELERELGLPLPRNARSAESDFGARLGAAMSASAEAIIKDSLGTNSQGGVVGPVYSMRRDEHGTLSTVLGTENAP